MKIIWAIDPFETETHPDATAIEALKAWNNKAGATIQPVYVLDVETYDEEGAAREMRGAHKAADHHLGRWGAGWTEKAVILSLGSPTVQGAAEALLRYARIEGASFIAVSSHGRTGITKAILGSFAETLLRYSEIPVLFLSQEPGGNEFPSPMLGRVLFATDFSLTSRRAFLGFVSDVRKLNAKLALYHHLVPAPELVLATPGTIPYIPQRELEKREAEAKFEGGAWVKWAIKQGVQAELYIDRSEGSTAELILRAAREGGAGLIGLGTESNAVASFLLGSVSRHVFRERETPVWVAGPSFQRARENQLIEKLLNEASPAMQRSLLEG